MNDCVFCKIVRGELPAAKVFENENLLAFLDVGPVSRGHTLVIPKRHYENILEIPSDQLSALTSHLPILGRAIVKATGSDGFSLVQLNGECSGQVVMHLHFHIIPRSSGDGVKFDWPKGGRYMDGEGETLAAAIVEEMGCHGG